MWLRAATLLGLVALSAVALTTLYQSMMKERTAQLSNLVVLAHAAAQKAHDKEKRGALSREDAIKEATRTIGSFVDKDNLAVEVHTLPVDTTSILHAISAMRQIPIDLPPVSCSSYPTIHAAFCAPPPSSASAIWPVPPVIDS